MKILSSPGQYNDAGLTTIIPFSLTRHLYPFGTRMYRQDAFGSCLLQKVTTADFSLHFSRFDIVEKTSLYCLVDTPAIGLHFWLRGSVPALLPGYGKKMLEEGHYEMLYLPAVETEFILEKGVYESCWLELRPSLVAEMAEKHTAIKMLCQLLSENQPVSRPSIKVKMNTDVKNILMEMRNYRLVKTPEKIEVLLYGDVYKLLSIYDDCINTLQQIDSIALSRLEEKLLQIHWYITENADIHECSLSNLSLKFHVPKDTLKVNFKKRFGMPLYKFVQVQCMQRAKRMVDTTNHSAASIANELGYGNLSNFNKVFKKYFNCSPVQMRKIV